MYIVHVKRVTASDARRDWFRLLDEVAGGAVVSIERGGETILIQRSPARRARARAPDYSEVIRAPAVEHADNWTWAWPGPEKDLEPDGRDQN
jgi:hypothetical protein